MKINHPILAYFKEIEIDMGGDNVLECPKLVIKKGASVLIKNCSAYGLFTLKVAGNIELDGELKFLRIGERLEDLVAKEPVIHQV